MKRITLLSCLTMLLFSYGSIMAQSYAEINSAKKQETTSEIDTWSVSIVEEEENEKAENFETKSIQFVAKSNAGSKTVISTFPHIESFESDYGDWIQASDDDLNWSRSSGGTGSSNTGPNKASDGTYYIYTEASGYNNLTANLEADFDFSSISNPGIFFDYHMYGSSMGTLSIDVFDGSSWITDVWTKTGQQHEGVSVPFDSIFVDLTAYAGISNAKIRFSGTTGTNYYSDMAIDYIRVQDVPPMAYSSVTVSQPNTDNIFSGLEKQEILCINIETTGISGSLIADYIECKNIGSSNGADILNAKLYYTGTSSAFSTSTPLDTTLATGTGAFEFHTIQKLSGGNNYFWLAYDISSSASAGNLIDAQCNNIEINGSSSGIAITNYAPSGSRTIVNPPIMTLSLDTLKVTANTCNEEIESYFYIENISGGSNLDWEITEHSQIDPLKVAVLNNGGYQVTNVLNTQSDIQATNVSYYNSETLKNYDVLLNLRGQNLKQEDVLEFIHNGGTWIGEFSSNQFPFNDWNSITSTSGIYSYNSGSNSVNILDADHYLATSIDWDNIPVGSDPCDYMFDMRSFNDTEANVIASVNHSSYANNPLLIEKQYGAGKIIIFNWDYRDNAYYDAYVEDMIQEVVRYSGIENDVPWLRLITTSNSTPAGAQTQKRTFFNSDGLDAGIYYGQLVVESNDPASTYDTLVCEFTVEGEANIDSDISSITFGDTFINDVITKELTIYSNGCDTINISNLVFSDSEFSCSISSLDVLPGDSAILSIAFSPASITTFASTLTIKSNVSDLIINLSGQGTNAPAMLTSNDTLTTAVTACNANNTLQFNIENTGNAELAFSLNGKASRKVELLSLTNNVITENCYPNTLSAIDQYFTDYNLTEINTIDPSELETALIGKDVLLIATQDGGESAFTDLANVLQNFTNTGGAVIFCGTWSTELINNSGLFSCETYVSATSGTMIIDNPGPLSNGLSTSLTFSSYIYSHDFSNNNLVALGQRQAYFYDVAYREIGLGKAIYICSNYGSYGNDEARLIANAVQWGSNLLPNWLNASVYTDTIEAGATQNIDLNFDATNYNAGTYNFNLVINSNDPLNAIDTIVCEFNVSGTSEISSSVSLIDLGDILIGDSALYALNIYNLACDTLKISDVISSSSDFTLSSNDFSISPTDSLSVNVKFKPSEVRYYNDTIILKTNDKDWPIRLVGIGVAEPEMNVLSDTIEMILNDCNSTGSVPVSIENNGNGILSYELPSAGTQHLATGDTYDRTWAGAMFDIVTNKKITLSAFEMYYEKSDWNFEVEVYYREGTHVGHSSSDGWIHHGTYNLKSNDASEPDTINIDNLKLAAGNYGIYVRPTDYSFLFDYSTDNYTDDVVTIQPGLSRYDFNYWSLDDVIFKGGILYKTKEDWINFASESGTIASNTTEQINFEFSAEGLFPGDYISDIFVKSNDPHKNTDTVVCKLTVQSAAPAMEFASKSFYVGDGLANDLTSRELEVYNTGCDTLKITSISSNTSDFVIAGATWFNVLPGETGLINVGFTPSTTGTFTGSINVVSNDADSVINVSGNCTERAITAVTSIKGNAQGYHKMQDTIHLQIRYNNPITIDTTNGVPYIKLNTTPEAYARFIDQTSINYATFEYVVNNENCERLDYSSINDLVLNGGTIKYDGTVDAGISLPEPGYIATSYNFKIDTKAPVANITVPNAVTKDSVQRLWIDFGDLMLDLSGDDIVVSNATATLITYILEDKYALDVKAINDGEVTIDIPANICTDAAGNNNTASVQAKYSFDTSKPLISCNIDGSLSTNKSSFTLSINLNEKASELRLSEIEVSNGFATNLVEVVPDKQYTCEVTLLAQEDAIISFDAGIVQDKAGNLNKATAQTIAFDNVNPTVVLSSTDSSITSNPSINVEFTFDEKITDFELDDITTSNAIAENLRTYSYGLRYMVDIIPLSNGEVTINVPANSVIDLAGNLNVASNELKFTYDSIAPTVVLSTQESTLTNSSSIEASIVFNDVVTGFDSASIALSNAELSSLIVVTEGLSYTMKITPQSDGKINIDIPEGSATDAAGNGNTASNQLSLTYDSKAPNVEISTRETSPTNNTNIEASIVFSEAVVGFEMTDITLTNATASNFVELTNGLSYTVNITPINDGEVTASILADVALDSAANTNTKSNQLAITIDATAPTISITSETDYKSNKLLIPVTIEFSEKVTGFSTNNLLVQNATASNLVEVIAGIKYSAEITPDTSGIITVCIADSVVYDLVGNANTASDTLSRLIDYNMPVLSEIEVLNITEQSAQVQFISSKDGMAHYIIQNASDTAPTISKVLLSGSIELQQTDAIVIDCNDLKTNTNYTVYIISVDNYNNQSELYMVDFTTETVGFELETNENIMVYPNPTKGKITIEPKGAAFEQITILNLNGKIVYQTSDCSNGTIDLSNLEPQLYMLHILTQNGITVTKIVKE